MKRIHKALFIALLASITTVQGCAFVTGAAVGAAAYAHRR